MSACHSADGRSTAGRSPGCALELLDIGPTSFCRDGLSRQNDVRPASRTVPRPVNAVVIALGRTEVSLGRNHRYTHHR